MEIKGKVYCFFEQSGTFKNEFIKLGIPAEDYDIQDNFGQTDHVVDLFENIQNAYEGGASVFDNITNDDLIVAFFPCIYFSCLSAIWFGLDHHDYKNWDLKRKFDYMLDRSQKRTAFFETLYKFVFICLDRGLRMIMENPWSENHFLKSGYLKPPTIVDNNRLLRGDCYKKPTAYWFWNCENTYGHSYQQPKKVKRIVEGKKHPIAGMCSEERSIISHDYARNFICDFILGKKQDIGQISLF
ncbi:MAG: hypothetical protein II242_05645 [Peptococcaceae bacterium]|nr:hypothetical protein [Peptococcaceae bacterium]